MTNKITKEDTSNPNKNKVFTNINKLNLSPWEWVDDGWVRLSFKPSKDEVSND
jgi:hypothetical protein